MKILFPLLTIMLAIMLSTNAKAQYSYTTGTLTLTESEFTALTSQTDGIEVAETSIGQYSVTGNGPYIPNPCPCGDSWTRDYIDFCISEANRLCQPVFPCVRRCDCSWWVMMICPTDPNCPCVQAYSSIIPVKVFAAP